MNIMGLKTAELIARIKAMPADAREKKELATEIKSQAQKQKDNEELVEWLMKVDAMSPEMKKQFGKQLVKVIERNERNLTKAREKAENLPKRKILTDSQIDGMFVLHVLTGLGLGLGTAALTQDFLASASVVFGVMAASGINVMAQETKPLNGIRGYLRDKKVKKLERKQALNMDLQKYVNDPEVLEM